jgi:cell division protein FtsB
MAIDNTPPRLRLIVTIAVIVIITLLGLNFVFESYYAIMTDQARFEKLAPTTAKNEQHAAETAALAGGKMPIEKAMAQLKGDRAEAIAPKPSDDLGSMTGWSKLPKQAPLPIPAVGMHVTETMSADGGAMSADGGAMSADGGAMSADGGAMPMGADGGAHAADAGAHKGTGAHAPH